MPALVQIAIGGAAGAVLRHLTAVGVARALGPGAAFPIGVLAVNVAGSFLMGAAVALLARQGAALAPLVTTGFLGGFTTFSAFSLEAVALYERGAAGLAALYVGLSVGGAIGALAAGLALGRAWA